MGMFKLRPLKDWSWVMYLYLMLLLYSSIVGRSLIFSGAYPPFFICFSDSSIDNVKPYIIYFFIKLSNTSGLDIAPLSFPISRSNIRSSLSDVESL